MVDANGYNIAGHGQWDALGQDLGHARDGDGLCPYEAREIVASALSEQEIAQFDELLRKVRDKALERLGQQAEVLPGEFDVERFEADAANRAHVAILE